MKRQENALHAMYTENLGDTFIRICIMKMRLAGFSFAFVLFASLGYVSAQEDAPLEPITASTAPYVVRAGHTGEGYVTGIAWSTENNPDRPSVYAIAQDEQIKLYHPPAELFRTLRYDGAEFINVAISPDGNLVAASGTHGLLYMWETGTGDLHLQLETGSNSRALNAIAFNADGSLIAAAENTSVFIWSVSNGELLRTLVHNAAVQAIAFAPQDNQLVTAADDAGLRRWSLENGRTTAVNTLLSPAIDISFSSDGTDMVTVSEGYQLLLWVQHDGAFDHQSIELFDEIERNLELLPYIEVGLNADGSQLAFPAHQDVRLYSLDADQEHPARIGYVFPIRSVTKAVFSPDGSLILAASPFSASVFNLMDGSVLTTLIADTRPVSAVEFDDEGTIHTQTGTMPELAPGTSAWCRDTPITSPDGRFTVTCAGMYGVNVRDTEASGAITEIPSYRVDAVGFSPDSTRLVTYSIQCAMPVSLVEIATGRLILQTYYNSVFPHFSSDGSVLALSSRPTWRPWQSDFYLYDAWTGVLLNRLTGHHGTGQVIAFSPDATLLATAGSEDRHGFLWAVSPDSTPFEVVEGEDVLNNRPFSSSC